MVLKKAYVTLHGGLGNQLFQAAFAVWLQQVKGIDVQLIDPGNGGTPGPHSRVCQIDKLLRDEEVIRGTIARFLHVFSLSRRWQAVFGRLGLVRRFSLPYKADVYQLIEFENSLSKKSFTIAVFYGYWQEKFVLNSAISKLKAQTLPELKSRSNRINHMLSRSERPLIADTLVVHVRRGDLATVTSAILLGPSYYELAFSALHEYVKSPYAKPKAIGIVSDQPEEALSMIQPLQPSAYIIDLDDPLDVLAALSLANSRILANSTLSIWGGLFSSNHSPTVYSEVWDLDQSHGSQLCNDYGWIAVDPKRAKP